jgi:hypothetical protein
VQQQLWAKSEEWKNEQKELQKDTKMTLQFSTKHPTSKKAQ